MLPEGYQRTINAPARRAICRRSQRLPRYGSRVLLLSVPGKWLLVHWTARSGYWCLAVGKRTPRLQESTYSCQRPGAVTVKRRIVGTAAHSVVPALPATSLILAKLPAIREFLTATSYDDGTSREPGYLTLRNRRNVFEVTLYDPDAGLRLPVQAKTLDDVLALTEQLVGVEEAPWEVDDYLTSRLARLKTRKKKS